MSPRASTVRWAPIWIAVRMSYRMLTLVVAIVTSLMPSAP